MRTSRFRRSSILAVLASATILGALVPVSAGAESTPSRKSEAHRLTQREIAASNITNTARGRKLIASFILQRGRTLRPHTSLRADVEDLVAYDFGVATLVASVSTPVRVLETVDSDGEVAQDVILSTGGRSFDASAGFVIPPPSKFVAIEDLDAQLAPNACWRRYINWTVTKADNYASGGVTADYYRMYGIEKAWYTFNVTCNATDNSFRRAWLEFDRKAGWSAVQSFELAKPVEGIGIGSSTTEKSIGFGSSLGWTVVLGPAPVALDGSVNASYGSKITSSTENWHPISRDEIGSGGVQWCRYATSNFTSARLFTGSVSAQVAPNGTMNDWDILSGQQVGSSKCPDQV